MTWSSLLPGCSTSTRANQNVSFCNLTFHVLHDHAEVTPGFKGAEHADHKRVLCKGQDVAFHKDLLDLVPQHQVLLVNLLDGKPLASLLVPHQVHSPKGT